MPNLLTTDEVAELLRVQPPAVRRMVRLGKLPAANIGTTRRPIYRFAATDIAAWLAGSSA